MYRQHIISQYGHSWPGKRTNEVSSVPIQVKPFKNGFERCYNEADILLSMHPSMTDGTGSSARNPAEVLASLQLVNYYEITGQMGTGWLKEGDDKLPAFVGVLRNEMATSGV